MKLLTFEIKFDNRQGVFECGKLISGQLHMHLASPMKMRSLKIFFVGESKSFWDERSGKHTTKYRAREHYLNNLIQIYPTAAAIDGGNEHPAGNHVYPFALALPTSIPSSFEGRRGYVRYFCKATIDRPWKFDSHVKRAFTVIRHLDLNAVSSAVVPIHAARSMEIEGCCCSEGNIDVALEINKGGFVPGEPIVYDIKIDNKSENDVSRVVLELQQKATYTGYSSSIWSSGHPSLHPKFETFGLFSGVVSIPKNSSGHINRATIVPSLPPSHLEGCEIIDIQYWLNLKVPCGSAKVVITRNIVIGTIPVREEPMVVPSAPSNISDPVLQPSAGGTISPPSYEEVTAPPPSYSECVFGRTQIRDENDDEHTGGDVSWAPAYPYYDWSTHSTETYGGHPPSVATTNSPAYD